MAGDDDNGVNLASWAEYVNLWWELRRRGRSSAKSDKIRNYLGPAKEITTLGPMSNNVLWDWSALVSRIMSTLVLEMPFGVSSRLFQTTDIKCHDLWRFSTTVSLSWITNHILNACVKVQTMKKFLKLQIAKTFIWIRKRCWIFLIRKL